MARQEMTVDRFEEIKRLLGLKVSVIQIARTVKCTERTVRQIRDGEAIEPGAPREIAGPVWAESVEWSSVLTDVLEGHPIKFIWAERAQEQIGYKAFWEQFHRRFPHYKSATSVHRVFAPGERCEVDYAGDKIEWIDIKTGEIFEASVFVAILGYSQKIFAEATSDQKGRNFVESHVRMYRFFGGVPKVTVPDCLKQGVSRVHLYDPELNKSYQAMAKDFGTAIVPARPGHPKDKALVEGAVRIFMCYFRWCYRRQTFMSLEEINEAIRATLSRLNAKPHTRFKVSRDDAWSENEKPLLKEIPSGSFEYASFKEAIVHPDSHVAVDASYYSVPHRYRGQRVQVKITESTIEVFVDLERVAAHRRSRRRIGEYVTDLSHLPENAKAYLEATPQNILSQAKFLSRDLYTLIDELFTQNTSAHLRRAQGLVRSARKEINAIGAGAARASIKKAIETMRRYDKVRVPYFDDLLKKQRSEVRAAMPTADRITRRPNNPNIRYSGKPQLALILSTHDEPKEV